jgi:transcriptional regulator with XRE-family HTH domain
VEKSLDQRTPAQRLIEMRQDMGLSQTALSRKIGVQSTSISLIEHERISMSAKFAQRVEDELGIGADWLLYGDESQKRWPCSGRMIDYLRRHPEERRKIWMEMRGNRDQDMFLSKTDDNPGNRIRTARIKGGMNQQMFARKIQVQQSTVSRIENGDIHITDDMMQRICEALGADENWIRHGENE